MKSVAITLAFIGCSASASTNGYDLKIDLSLNGKHVSSPRILVKAGETATVTQKTGAEESFIEVIANEGSIHNHQGILLNFTVGLVDQNGRRMIKAKPQVLAEENTPAQITVGESGDEVSLAVIANRKSL